MTKITKEQARGYFLKMCDHFALDPYAECNPELNYIMSCIEQQDAVEVDGFVTVPIEPTVDQWSGLARDIISWTRFQRPTGEKLHKHLLALGHVLPQWFIYEIPNVNTVPPKGTVAAIIYKAMIAAAPKHDKKG